MEGEWNPSIPPPTFDHQGTLPIPSALLLPALAAAHGQPQLVARLRHGFGLAEEGLRQLAGLGLQLHLAEGPEPTRPEWPKILFHIDAAPNGRVVANQWELEDLGSDWYGTLEDAQHQNGRKLQFAGRGGVGIRNVPVISGPPPAVSEADQDAKAALIAFWRMTNKWPLNEEPAE